MRAHFKVYQQLDGPHKQSLSRIGDGNIIRLFDKTPFPNQEHDVICPHFMELACIYGCAYSCAWCYLKGTYRYILMENGRVPIRIKKFEEIDNAINSFLELDLEPMILNTGELADSLQTEQPIFYGQPFSEYLMKKFQGSKHKILFLSKGTNVKNFLRNKWQETAILSWSLNADIVAKRWEHLAPNVGDRIEAANTVWERGYEVRIRIDPMVNVEGWQDQYQRLVNDIYDSFVPERITLGCLRGLASTVSHVQNNSWIQYLEEETNWGLKPREDVRYAMYSHLISCIRQRDPNAKIGVCKETLRLWRRLATEFGLDYKEITCNCVW